MSTLCITILYKYILNVNITILPNVHSIYSYILSITTLHIYNAIQKKIVWCSSYYLSHLMLVSSYVCRISHFVLSYVSHIWYWSHLSYVCCIWHSVLSDIGLIWCVPHLTSCIVLCLSHLTYISYYVDVSYTWLIWQKYHITSVCLTRIFVP